jgi:hypothetical protein
MYSCKEGYIVNLKKKKSLPFATTWINLDDIIQNKIN